LNPQIRIDFNRPCMVGKELDYIAQAVQDAHISGDGSFTKKCRVLLQQVLDVPAVLLTTSCTHALEMTALLLDLKPGDEVVIPSFTFVSTVNAYVLRGAKPVFIDIRTDTLNMDEAQLESKITPHTRAIVPVHYAGVGCEMDTILAIARKYNLAVIEDNAHGLFGKYKGKNLGTFGVLATQSFHETKNITCGEGGAIVINSPDLVEKAEIIREKGTDRSRFFRGQVDKYTWVAAGSSYLPSDILAAFLYAQLENWQTIQIKRKHIWDYYYTHMIDWANENKVRLPIVPAYCEQSYHMFYLLMPDLNQRQAMISHLKQRGITSVFHYQPLHLSDMGRKYGGRQGDCPVTEKVSDQLLRLPFYYELTDEDLHVVVESVKDFNDSC
jgi:dTDP-4-amino-4,6-dideoxygalactose transaminase